MSSSPESVRELDHQQNEPLSMVSGVTNQVIHNINHATELPRRNAIHNIDHESPRRNVIHNINHATESPRSNASDSVVDADDDKEQEEELQDEEAEVAVNSSSIQDLIQLDDNPNLNYCSFDDLDPPPGYKFDPSEFELIIFYLKRKILGERLPWNKIMDVELYNHSPEWLTEQYPQYGKHEWYFFTPRERKYKNGIRPNRAAGDGFWKATGADKKINSKTGIRIGFRKALVFYRGKPPKGEKTNWIMHEYRINHPPLTKRNPDDMRLDKWVLCKIYWKSESNKSSKPQQSQDEICSTSSQDGDRIARNEAMINQSHQNVPNLDHVTSRLANQFQPMGCNNYGPPHRAHMPSRFSNEIQALAGNHGNPPQAPSFPTQLQPMATNYGTLPQMGEPLYPLYDEPLSNMVDHFPNMPFSGQSNFSTNELSGYMHLMPSDLMPSDFPPNELRGYQETSNLMDLFDDYHMDDSVPNKRMKNTDDHHP